jgi:hypothetical protein
MRVQRIPLCTICIVLSPAMGIRTACAQAALAASAPILSFSRITASTPLPNGIELRDGALIMRITAMRADVFAFAPQAPVSFRKMHPGPFCRKHDRHQLKLPRIATQEASAFIPRV